MRTEFYINKPPSPRLRRSGKKGRKISAVLYSKNGKVENKQTLILCHGFTGFKEEMFYPVFFARLVKADYQVISFDMNGHGKSYGDFIDFAISKAVDDFKTVYDYVKSRGVKRIGIMGHSIGGAVCLLVANKIQIQSIILLSPVSQPGFYNKYLIPNKSDRDFLRNFGFYPRHSYKRGKYYPVGLNFFKDFEKQSINKEAKAMKRPILLIHAGNDKAVPLTDSQKLFKFFDFDITAFKIIRGADHNFNKRLVYQQVIKLSLDWLDKYLKKHTDNVMTAILQRKDGKILIVKRSEKEGTYAGYWHGIGGYLNKNESPMKTAAREIEEELRIENKYLKFIRQAKPIRIDDTRYDKDWRIHYVLFETNKTKVKLDWETDKVKWVWPKDMLKYKIVSKVKIGLKRLRLI